MEKPFCEIAEEGYSHAERLHVFIEAILKEVELHIKIYLPLR
jgi:hypothetical protein